MGKYCKNRKARREGVLLDVAILQNTTVPILLYRLGTRSNINYSCVKSKVEKLVDAGLLMWIGEGYGAKVVLSERGREVLGLWFSFDSEYTRAMLCCGRKKE